MIRIPDDDGSGPVVRNPRLREVVELVRQQEPVAFGKGFEAVRDQWIARRRRSRRRWAVAVAVAATAIFAVRTGVSLVPRSVDLGTAARLVAVSRPVPMTSVRTASFPMPDLRPRRALDAPYRVHESRPGRSWVVGPSEIAVFEGTFDISVASEASSPLLVHVGSEVLQVDPGATLGLTVDAGVELDVRSGRVQWRRPSGDTEGAGRADDPAVWLRRAEAAMGRGDRRAAIEAFEHLVDRFGRTRVARAALLDLARLQRAQGHSAAAYCAYWAYLRRDATTSVRAEIEGDMRSLGVRPRCRGFRPR